jgi:TRAP-type C4-dicarboxylate transport system substrate-binding protein
MRIVRRTFLVSTLSAVAAPAVLRLARADAPQFVLKLHHSFSSVSSAHDKFFVPWARQVEAQSGGRIRIDLFPSMQLGGAPAQLYDQARDGIADIVWAMPSTTPGRFPKIEAWELPLVPSVRALVSSKAIDDYGRANLTDEFREVHPLCFSCSDRGVLHANRPVRIIEDMKDLRLHVQTRFASDAVHAMGAVGIPMPNAQLPLAITQHVVDGCIDPWDMMPALKLNDLLKTHTEFADSSLSSTTFALVMNKASYDRLPRDLKDVIDANSGQAAAGAAGAMWDLQARAVADSVARRGDPITTLLPESVAHWRKATEPVVNAWLKALKDQKADGGKLLASAHALLVKYANEPEPQPAQTSQPEEVSEPAQSSEQSLQSQPRPPAEAKADTGLAPKADLQGAVPSQPAASAPAAPSAPAPASAQPQTSWWRSWFGSKPAATPPSTPSTVATASATPAPAPDQPQTSWWRSWFGSKSAAAPAKTPAAVQTPVTVQAPATVTNPPPVVSPAASASAATPVAVAPSVAPIPDPSAVTPVPAPAASAPAINPAPIPAPVTPVVKPAAKALDIPL